MHNINHLKTQLNPICHLLALLGAHHILYVSRIRFNIHGSVHRKNIPIYIQQDATLHSLFIPGNCSICFGWYPTPIIRSAYNCIYSIWYLSQRYCYLPLSWKIWNCNFGVVLCILCFVSFSVLFLCICVLYYCHRVATQLQLNISYIISYHFFFAVALRPNAGHGLLILDVSRSHTTTHHIR